MTTLKSGQFIGCMTGTSVDGLDLALVDVGADEQFSISHAITLAMPEGLQRGLLQLGQPGAASIDELGASDQRLGVFIGEGILDWLSTLGISTEDIVAIGSHGQTIRHRPAGTTAAPFTIQIGDPNQIAEITGITTVADFRRRDMAAGGEGAPLVPAFHGELFADRVHPVAVLNMGGISNLTILGQPVRGFDSGPGNALLDAWYQSHQAGASVSADTFDRNGAWARSGTASPSLLKHLLADDYFASAPPKSTGREYFSSRWLTHALTEFREIKPPDVQATLTELTAASIAGSVATYASETEAIAVCGGGRLNAFLMQRLAEHCSIQLGRPCRVEACEAWGVDGDAIEAAAFAWLAFRRLNGLTGSLSSVTGARQDCVLGAIYPA